METSAISDSTVSVGLCTMSGARSSASSAAGVVQQWPPGSDFRGCQTATTLRFSSPFTARGSRLAISNLNDVLQRSKRVEEKKKKSVKGTQRLCPSLRLGRCCHPLKVSRLWKNQRPSKPFQLSVSAELRTALAEVRFLPRPLEYSSHSLRDHIYISI